MTQELELSIMADSAAGMADRAAAMQPLLHQFEAERHIRVRLRLLTWDTAWSDLVKVALYSDGPDVSEIGTTWLGDLVAMNALRPFDAQDIAALGAAAAFLPSAWQGGHMVGQSQMWAIPWLTGARLIFFRRRWLEHAGLDGRVAFQTIEQADQTIQGLQAAGSAAPWTVPTGLTHTTLLNVASWVWGAGGDFVTADGRRTLFCEAAARAGFRAYFALGRFLAPPIRHLTGLEPDEQFLSDDQTAATLSGPWLFYQARQRGIADAVGMALPPGASFVGGSHLVAWKHTREEGAVLELIRFLTRPEVQSAYAQHVGLLPTRLDALEAPPYATEPLWQLAISGIRTGRSFPVTRSWGLMEDRLTRELSALWGDVLADPGVDLEAAITKRLEPLAMRLDLVLGQF
jgi:multiple sugar transport system substrate-binding protein